MLKCTQVCFVDLTVDCVERWLMSRREDRTFLDSWYNIRQLWLKHLLFDFFIKQPAVKRKKKRNLQKSSSPFLHKGLFRKRTCLVVFTFNCNVPSVTFILWLSRRQTWPSLSHTYTHTHTHTCMRAHQVHNCKMWVQVLMGKVHGSYLVWALLTLIPQKFWKKSLQMPLLFSLTPTHRKHFFT